MILLRGYPRTRLERHKVWDWVHLLSVWDAGPALSHLALLGTACFVLVCPLLW